MQIRKVMTEAPQTIGATRSLAEARALMQEHSMRHLPVLAGGRLVGILSDRDLNLIEALEDLDASTLQVQEAMTQEVLEVEPQQSVQRVSSEMARRKCGSALVTKNGKILGIFTTTDALELLARPPKARSGTKVLSTPKPVAARATRRATTLKRGKS